MDEAVINKVEEFFSSFPLKKYDKGEIIIHGGEVPPGIFYLVKGTVRQYDITYFGNEVVVNVYKPGAFFPMSWAVNRNPNEYFFEVASQAEMRVAPADECLKFVKANSDVEFDLLKRLYSGLDGVLRRLKYLMKGTAQSKTLLELVIEAKRFGKPKSGTIVVDISEEEFANRAGLSRETASRELHTLHEEGLIKIKYGQLTVKKLDVLEKRLADSL